jgi:hypothetical protein
MEVKGDVTSDTTTMRTDDGLNKGTRHGSVNGVAALHQNFGAFFNGNRLRCNNHAGHSVTYLSFARLAIGKGIVGKFIIAAPRRKSNIQ